MVPGDKLMTMSPLCPCGKPCSTGTHNKTEEKLTLFSAIINGIMMESRLRVSNPVGMLSVLKTIREFYHIYTVTIVIHKCRNLIGTQGIAEFGPK